MAANSEELLLRLGLDAGSMQAGTYKMLDAQKKASMEYVGFWESAFAKRAASEEAANDASLARLAANTKAKEAITAKFFAEQAAQYEIAAGSIPAGMAGGAEGVAGGAARRAEGGVGGSILAGATGGMVGGRAARGFFTTLKETMLGSSRAWWSAARLALVELSATAAAWGAAILLPLAAIVGPSAFKTYRARQAAAESGKDLKTATGNAESILRGRIADMVRSGVISKDDARMYNERLGASSTGLNNVFSEVNALVPQQKKVEAAKAALKAEKENRELQREEAKEARANASAAARMKDDKLQQAEIQARISALNKNDIGYADMLLQLQKESRDVEADALADKKKMAELQKQEINKERELANKKKELLEREKEYPTIANLAGRDFESGLDKDYGAGGRFDLGIGDGKMGDVARDYLLRQKQQIWDRTYGNKKEAELDRLDMITDRDKLFAAGVAPDEMKWDKTREEITTLTADIAEIKKSLGE